MPDLQLQQYPMNSLARMPNLQLNSNQQQSQLQNTIRVMVESELARTRNSNQQTNPKSVTGSQQEAAQFHLA